MKFLEYVKIMNETERFPKPLSIYRHFKQEKNGEIMNYIVTACSIPRDDFKELFDMELTNEIEHLKFHHTELERDIDIVRIASRYYHDSNIEKEILPIYTALYGDRKTYLRPLSMFLSKTDKVKYPNATQEYRLEKIN